MTKSRRHWYGAIFAAFSLSLIMLGCESDEACSSDGDCGDELLCYEEACVPQCEWTPDCNEGYVCRIHTDGVSQICVLDEWPVDEETCGPVISGLTCPEPLKPVVGEPGFEYWHAQVLDRSVVDCEADEPGSDLIYISLEDSDGSVLAYGNIVDDGTTGDLNLYKNGVNLNGSPPMTEECPEFDDMSVTSLGCGGFITFEFLTPDGNRVSAEAGTQVRVFEFGSQCFTDDTTPDEFGVYLCTDPNNTPATCTYFIGSGSGEIVALVP